MKRLAGLTLAMMAALAGCTTSKVPERFHTLLPADPPATMPAQGLVHVHRIGIPPQADHPQWVVRQPDESLLMLEQDRWAAPLQDELRGAIAARLAAHWGFMDTTGMTAPPGPVLSVRVDVQRFESVPGREARIEAIWILGPGPGGLAAVACRSIIQEAVDAPGITPLAAAHRRAAIRLADEIGRQLSAMRQEHRPTCPLSILPSDTPGS